MGVDMLIRDVPESLAGELRRRAAAHHRSLEDEVIGILERDLAEKPRLTPAQFVAKIRAMGIRTPSESVAWIREDRDARSRD